MHHVRCKSLPMLVSLKEQYMKEQTVDEMELYAYKFKQWLGSVTRELQNRQLKDIPYQGDNG